jgi:hypothetical protein
LLLGESFLKINQSDLDDTNILTPNIFLRQQGNLGHIVITENEVEDILRGIFFENGNDVGTFPISRKYSSSKR